MFKFVKLAGKNEEGRPIYEALTLNQIDKLACEFWGVEEHPRFYASPKILIGDIEVEYGANWFDTIGHAIEDCQYRCRQNSGEYNYYHDAVEQPYKYQGPIFEASTVCAQIIRVASLATHSADDLEKSIKHYRPYIELLFHLQNEHGILFEALGW